MVHSDLTDVDSGNLVPRDHGVPTEVLATAREATFQVTGLGSLFGIHFTNHPIVNYRDIAAEDSVLRNQVFLGLMNEGILMASNLVGGLSTALGEEEVDTFVGALRRVLERQR